MKNIKYMLACLLCSFIIIPFSSANNAHAVEVKFSGLAEMSLDWGQGWAAFHDTPYVYRDNFMPTQRIRIWMDAKATEDLKFVFGVESGFDFGNNGDGGALGGDGYSLKIKHAYLDWRIAGSNLKTRIGLQRFAIPGLMRGNAILGDDGAGVTASYEVNDNFSINAFWLRPWNDNIVADTSGNAKATNDDESDFFAVLLPIKFDEFQITPWIMYGQVGRGAFEDKKPGFDNPMESLGCLFAPLYGNYGITTPLSDQASGFMLGAHTKLQVFDPFRIELETDYGSMGGFNAQSARKGWLVAGLAELALGKITPGILFWYGSGDDANINNGSEQLPMLAPEWAATSLGFGRTVQTRGVTSNAIGYGPAGTWALGAQFTVVPVPKSINEIRFVYLGGTNNNAMGKYNTMAGTAPPSIFRGAGTNLYLLEDDRAWEVNWTSMYQLNPSLMLAVELGYMELHLDEALYPVGFSYRDSVYRVATTLVYKF